MLPCCTSDLNRRQVSLDALLGSLALKLLVVENESQAAIMRARWESRDSRQVRPPALREFSRKGGLARWKGTTPELRRKLMQAVWKTRTKPAQLSAHAPAENSPGAP
jgi:hypothetical protein